MPIFDTLLTILDSVGSTNNYAMAKVHAGLAKHGNAFFTYNQTEGKGQRGKVWQSDGHQNIALSIVIEPTPLLITEQFKLSAIVALACFEFFRSYAGEETKIKWPNDIYWRDRKAAGVLIENIIGNSPVNKNMEIEVIKNYWKYAVIGIGININQTMFTDELKKAVSLKQITGKDFNVLALAQELHLLVLKKLEEHLSTPISEILKLYNEKLFKKNEPVKFKKDNIIFESIIESVTENGQLLTNNGLENIYNFGEVEWVL